jgi:hypothetical protein
MLESYHFHGRETTARIQAANQDRVSLGIQLHKCEITIL